MTDREVWLEIAAHIKGGGFLVVEYAWLANLPGICEMLCKFRRAKVICEDQYWRLEAQLHCQFADKFDIFGGSYLAPTYAWKPRLKILQELAKHAKH